MKKTLTQNRIAAALAFAGALAAANAAAQSHPGFDRPLTLAPADVTSSGGGAGADDEKARAAELAKKLSNPIASLISLPLQNNFDWVSAGVQKGISARVQKGTEFRASIFRGFRASC